MLSLDATVHILWLGTPIAACLSGVTVMTALSIDAWLKSEEKILNPSYRNGSSKVEFLSKKTTSGLFTLCTTNVGAEEFHCQRIDYFPTEEYSPDPTDSTMAIPHTVLKSVGFFLTAVILLTFAELLCISGHCCNRRRFFTFLSGITFIISGLLMMLGMVIYIATLKGEVAEKLRPRSTFQPPLFAYTYGWSCYLIMLGFITTEMAGISAIFLYIYWHKRDWSKKDEQKYNSQMLETPPPCLKHSRQRSLSFHSNMEQDTSFQEPIVRRSRSQQYLEEQSQDHPMNTRQPNHVSHNQMNHQNHNHISQYTHPQPCQQPVYNKQPPNCYQHYNKESQRSLCDLESLHQPQSQGARSTPFQHSPRQFQQQQPQIYQYHQQYPYKTSSSQHSVHWSNKSLDNVPRRGISKSDYLDEILISKSGSLPRSNAREGGAVYRGGSTTLPRSFPRSCDSTVCGSQSRNVDGSMPRYYAKDDTALCNSFSRKGFQYPGQSNSFQYSLANSNAVCNGQGGVCSMGAECCSCCTCYCCCCCWQDESNGTSFRNPPGTHGVPTSSGTTNRAAWQGKYGHNPTPQIQRNIGCSSATCSAAELSASPRSMHHRQQPPSHHQPPYTPQTQHQQRRKRLQHSLSHEMPSVSFDVDVVRQEHPGYQPDPQRHTTPV